MAADAQRLAVWREAKPAMWRMAARLVGIGLVLLMAASLPASAQSVRCDQMRSSPDCPDRAAQKKRPRVTIYPRRVYPGPNAKRQCYAWLAQEYRVSGPVIVPQMRCWWE
ncbi:MAG TPA: hypothetical protein VFB29_15895 [Pseudolabrys sp.]|nr:hypothetical protein [Pseudolabrys sp.]